MGFKGFKDLGLAAGGTGGIPPFLFWGQDLQGPAPLPEPPRPGPAQCGAAAAISRSPAENGGRRRAGPVSWQRPA